MSSIASQLSSNILCSTVIPVLPNPWSFSMSQFSLLHCHASVNSQLPDLPDNFHLRLLACQSKENSTWAWTASPSFHWSPAWRCCNLPGTLRTRWVWPARLLKNPLTSPTTWFSNPLSRTFVLPPNLWCSNFCSARHQTRYWWVLLRPNDSENRKGEFRFLQWCNETCFIGLASKFDHIHRCDTIDWQNMQANTYEQKNRDDHIENTFAQNVNSKFVKILSIVLFVEKY